MKQHQPYILVGGLCNCAIARNMRQAQNLNHWWRFALPMPHCNWSFVVSSCSMENPHRSRWKSSTCRTPKCQDWDPYCESDRQTQAFCFPVELRNTINTISMMSKAMATKLHVECEAPQFFSPAKLPIWGTGCYRHLGAWRAVRFVVGDGQQYGHHVTGFLDHGKKSTL